MSFLTSATLNTEFINQLDNYKKIHLFKEFLHRSIVIKLSELKLYLNNFGDFTIFLNYENIDDCSLGSLNFEYEKEFMDAEDLRHVIKTLVYTVEDFSMHIFHGLNVKNPLININFGFIDRYRVYLSVELL